MKRKTIKLPLTYEIGEESFDPERFLKLRIKVMHSGLNLNNSYFGSDVIEKAKPTLANIPILAFIKKEDGTSNEDFAGHEFEIKITEEDFKYVYLGRPIGIIPETNNYSIETDEDGKQFVVVDGYVWKQYANSALDIVQRDEVKKVSMEVLVNDYDWEETHVKVLDYSYTGIAMLGEDVREAMIGAKAEIINYSRNTISDMLIEWKDALKGGQEKMTLEEQRLQEEEQAKLKAANFQEEEKEEKDETDKENFEEQEIDPDTDQEIEKENFEEEKEKKEEKEVEAVDFKAQITELQNEIETLKIENSRLQEFVDATQIKAKEDAINELFAKFNDLGESEEAKALLEKAGNMKLSDIETQLYALRGRLGTFSKKEEQEEGTKEISDFQKLMFKYTKESDSALPEWASLVSKRQGKE